MENAPLTLDMVSGSNPGNTVSAIQGFPINDVENTDTQNAFGETLALNEVKKWADTFAAAPAALNATGKCFILALSGDVDQIVQKRFESIPTDLRTNLVNCNNLAWETFVEAEENLEKLRKTIAMITGRCGIMDKVLTAIDNTGSANQSESVGNLQASSEDLKLQLSCLEQQAQECLGYSGEVEKKFKHWESEVSKVCWAYTETRSIPNEPREQNGILLGQPTRGETKNGGKNTSLVRMGGQALMRLVKKNERLAPKEALGHPKGLDTQALNMEITKKAALIALGDCLNNLGEIKCSFTNLHEFFISLHQEIEIVGQLRLPPLIRSILEAQTKDSYKRMVLDDLHYDAYRIRCLFMHAESKASIYVKASQKYITPGAKLLNSFNSRTCVKHSDIAEMVVQLDGYHEDSLKGIHAFVEQLPTDVQLMKQIEGGGLFLGE